MPYDTTWWRTDISWTVWRTARRMPCARLYQRHGTSIYALAYGMLVDPGDAEEVVAETFAHLWRSAHGSSPRRISRCRPAQGHRRSRAAVFSWRGNA